MSVSGVCHFIIVRSFVGHWSKVPSDKGPWEKEKDAEVRQRMLALKFFHRRSASVVTGTHIRQNEHHNVMAIYHNIHATRIVQPMPQAEWWVRPILD